MRQLKTLDEKVKLSLKYILILLASLVMWLIPGGMLMALLSRFSFFTTTEEGAFLLVFVPHIIMFITLSIMSYLLLGKSILKLVDENGISKKGFITISLLTLIILSLSSLFSKETIIYNNNDTMGRKIVFLVLSLVLFLPQTLSEELVFRLLPAKIYSSAKGQLNEIEKIAVSLFSALFFTLPHLYNTEVLSSSRPVLTLSVYFIWGFLSSSLALFLSQYTTSWAMHYANNLFSTVIISGSGTTLIGAPFFYNTNNDTSPYLPLLIIFLFSVIFIIEFSMRRNKDEN